MIGDPGGRREDRRAAGSEPWPAGGEPGGHIDHPADHDLAERLSRERPVPAAAFRGTLGRYLAARDPGYGPRPGRLRLIVAGHILPGAVLMVLALLQATGWTP